MKCLNAELTVTEDSATTSGKVGYVDNRVADTHKLMSRPVEVVTASDGKDTSSPVVGNFPSPLNISHKALAPVPESPLTPSNIPALLFPARPHSLPSIASASTPLFHRLFTGVPMSPVIPPVDPTLYGLSLDDMSWLSDQALLFTNVSSCTESNAILDIISPPPTHIPESYDIHTHVSRPEDDNTRAPRAHDELLLLPVVASSSFAYRGAQVPSDVLALLEQVDEEDQSSLCADDNVHNNGDNSDNDDTLSELTVLTSSPDAQADSLEHMKDTLHAMWLENERKRLRRANKGLRRGVRGGHSFVAGAIDGSHSASASGGNSGASSSGTGGATPVRRITAVTPLLPPTHAVRTAGGTVHVTASAPSLPSSHALAQERRRHDAGECDSIEELRVGTHLSPFSSHPVSHAIPLSSHTPTHPHAHTPGLGLPSSAASPTFSAVPHRRLLASPPIIRAASLSASVFKQGSAPLAVMQKTQADVRAAGTDALRARARGSNGSVTDTAADAMGRSTTGSAPEDDVDDDDVVVRIVGGGDDNRMEAYQRFCAESQSLRSRRSFSRHDELPLQDSSHPSHDSGQQHRATTRLGEGHATTLADAGEAAHVQALSPDMTAAAPRHRAVAVSRSSNAAGNVSNGSISPASAQSASRLQQSPMHTLSPSHAPNFRYSPRNAGQEHVAGSEGIGANVAADISSIPTSASAAAVAPAPVRSSHAITHTRPGPTLMPVQPSPSPSLSTHPRASPRAQGIIASEEGTRGRAVSTASPSTTGLVSPPMSPVPRRYNPLKLTTRPSTPKVGGSAAGSGTDIETLRKSLAVFSPKPSTEREPSSSPTAVK